MNLISAFIAGTQFAHRAGLLAQDAKAKKDEAEGHWVTIGAEAGADGEKHGGRPVFIAGSKAESKKVEAKKAEAKKAESKAKEAESKVQKAAEKKAKAIKAAEDKYNASIGDFLRNQKHAPRSFAKDLMYNFPGKAATFEKVCANLSTDCKYLVKHALAKTKYIALQSNDERAFFSRDDAGVHFRPGLFKEGKWQLGMSNHQVIMHEFGHAVDFFAGNLAHVYRIGWNPAMLDAIAKDTSRIISAIRAEANKNYRSPAYSQQQADDRVAEYLKDIMYSRAENSDIHPSVVASISDMISAHTMNAIQDGGYHKTEYWRAKYAKSTEFIAHVFETSIDPELKKQFYNLFPTATKVLEKLISDTATTIRKEVAQGKIK